MLISWVPNAIVVSGNVLNSNLAHLVMFKSILFGPFRRFKWVQTVQPFKGGQMSFIFFKKNYKINKRWVAETRAHVEPKLVHQATEVEAWPTQPMLKCCTC
jgi:hypothetical protein